MRQELFEALVGPGIDVGHDAREVVAEVDPGRVAGSDKREDVGEPSGTRYFGVGATEKCPSLRRQAIFSRLYSMTSTRAGTYSTTRDGT